VRNAHRQRLLGTAQQHGATATSTPVPWSRVTQPAGQATAVGVVLQQQHARAASWQVCIYKGFCLKGGCFAIIMKLYSYSLAQQLARTPGGLRTPRGGRVGSSFQGAARAPVSCQRTVSAKPAAACRHMKAAA